MLTLRRLALIVAVLVLLSCQALAIEVYPPVPDESRLVLAYVEKVIDGDTAWCRVDEFGIGVTHTVRFLMVDTPETSHPDLPVQHWGPEAYEFTKLMLEDQEIWLEYDQQKTDHYNRQLCHIWLKDGTLFTLQLVELGFAQTAFYPPNAKYQKFFVAAQEYAQANDLGMWSKAIDGPLRIFDLIGVGPMEPFLVKTSEAEQVYLLTETGELMVESEDDLTPATMPELVFILNNPNRVYQ